MDKFNLNTFTLKLAVGTIWFVSIFLVICGFYNIFPFIEQLSSTSTWGIMVSIPTLVFSYAIGEIASYLSNSTFLKKSSNFEEIDDYIILANTKNEFLIKKYENLQLQYQFFKTCIPSAIFLGFSVVWSSMLVFKTSSSTGIKEISVALGLITMASSLIFIRMTNKKRMEIKHLIEKSKRT